MAPALARVREEDEAVKALILEALDVIRSDDFDRYFDLFTEDAVWMMPSSFRDVHQDEARSFYRFTRKFRFDQETAVDEVVVADDWAYVRVSLTGICGRRSMMVHRPCGQSVVISGFCKSRLTAAGRLPATSGILPKPYPDAGRCLFVQSRQEARGHGVISKPLREATTSYDCL